MVTWYYDYIKHRELTTELGGHKFKTTVGIGFPQGGVCSAKFWIIAFNRAVELVNTKLVTGFAFTDDLCALMGGKDLQYITIKIQKVINNLTDWGHTCGLKFSPEKTVTIIFTKKKKMTAKKLKIYGQGLEYKNSTQYLGLTIDAKLPWNEHINNVLTTNLGHLRQLINKTNSIYGPKPKLIKWAYTGVVGPRISYGIMIWGNKLQQKWHTNMLKQLNRTAIKGYTYFVKSTPTAAMEIATDTMPLKLYLLKMGMTSYMRLRHQLDEWEVDTCDSKNTSHLRESEMGNTVKEDDRCLEQLWNKQINFNLDSFSGAKKHIMKAEVTIYTDGSKTKDGVGAGIVVYYKNTRIFTDSFKLPNTATIFQAEIFAIKKRC